MKYAHILMAVASELWAMQPEKMAAMLQFLADQAAGEKYSAEEIAARIAPQTASATARREGAIAVLPVRGVLANRTNLLSEFSGGTSYEGLSAAYKSMLADDGIKAIVLDLDSPGGVVKGADEFSELVAGSRGKKPVVAQVNADAASAAYWIASAADEIVITPTGEVGSIGIIWAHDDVSAALEQAGVKRTMLTAGKFKGEGAPWLPLSDETRAAQQMKVESYYGMFVDRVAANRGVTTATVRGGFGQGRMVGAQEAVAEKMADRIGTLDETLARFGVATSTQSARRAAHARESRALAL